MTKESSRQKASGANALLQPGDHCQHPSMGQYPFPVFPPTYNVPPPTGEFSTQTPLQYCPKNGLPTMDLPIAVSPYWSFFPSEPLVQSPVFHSAYYPYVLGYSGHYPTSFHHEEVFIPHQNCILPIFGPPCPQSLWKSMDPDSSENDQQSSTEHRDRLFFGELRRDWEPRRVETFIRGLCPDATTIDTYPEGGPHTRNRGFAFVSFSDAGSAFRARERLRSDIPRMGGRPISVDWARAEHMVPAEVMRTISNLFVRNIPPGTTEAELREKFGGDAAGITRVKIQRNFGFIRYCRRAQAEVAKDTLDGTEMNGLRLEVLWARPPPPGTRAIRKVPPPSGQHQVMRMNQQWLNTASQLLAVQLQSGILPTVPLASIQGQRGAHQLEGYSLRQVELPPVPATSSVQIVSPQTTFINPPLSTIALPSFIGLGPTLQPLVSSTEPPTNMANLTERCRAIGLGEPRIHTAQYLINNGLFFMTSIVLGGFRFDGPFAQNCLEAEEAAATLMFNYFRC